MLVTGGESHRSPRRKKGRGGGRGNGDGDGDGDGDDDDGGEGGGAGGGGGEVEEISFREGDLLYVFTSEDSRWLNGCLARPPTASDGNRL